MCLRSAFVPLAGTGVGVSDFALDDDGVGVADERFDLGLDDSPLITPSIGEISFFMRPDLTSSAAMSEDAAYRGWIGFGQGASSQSQRAEAQRLSL